MTVQVTGYGGVPLAVETAGDPGAPAILLIHGWSQAGLSWRKQLEGPLAERFFLVAPDLRGHGASGKPLDPSAYNSAAPWAGDVQTVIDHFALRRPVLVGWSMGGKVLLDYLRVQGDAGLSGVVHVGSAVTSGRFTHPDALAQRGTPAVLAQGMYEDDLATNLAATLAFLQVCTSHPLPGEDLAWMMGFNMLCPPSVRAAARLRHEDYRPTAAATQVPALCLWGDQEQIMPRVLFDEAVQSFANAEGVVFEGCGHCTFWEDPARFDKVLGDFAARCHAAKEAA